MGGSIIFISPRCLDCMSDWVSDWRMEKTMVQQLARRMTSFEIPFERWFQFSCKHDLFSASTTVKRCDEETEHELFDSIMKYNMQVDCFYLPIKRVFNSHADNLIEVLFISNRNLQWMSWMKLYVSRTITENLRNFQLTAAALY